MDFIIVGPTAISKYIIEITIDSYNSDAMAVRINLTSTLKTPQLYQNEYYTQ